ncbi:hypothetical protein Acr_23g0020360 [Actinidia rufa]|uniref:Uncharacterized protein n=1 Tax=Actinidia rufa TaxID=165716 RepID=A0A7J0GSA8_9ERIC|nr:hypothetical protein Acr_23g0020360 [Actinidia rufa]
MQQPSFDRNCLWAQQLVSEPSSSHRRVTGISPEQISNFEQIQSAQNRRLSIPLDSSLRYEVPAPNNVKIGCQTSPHELPKVRRVNPTRPHASQGWSHMRFGGDVPGEDISEQNLNEEACVEVSERDYSSGTYERVPEARSKKRPEKRSQEEVKRRGLRRGLKKEVTEVRKRGREEVKEEIPADDGGGKNSEASTTAVMAVRVFKGNRRCYGRKKTDGYIDWRRMSRQEELLSDMGPVILARRMNKGNNRCTEARKASAGVLKGCTGRIQSGTRAQGEALGYMRKFGQTRAMQLVQDVHGEAQRRETKSMYSDRRDVAEIKRLGVKALYERRVLFVWVECYGASESNESTERSDRERARIGRLTDGWDSERRGSHMQSGLNFEYPVSAQTLEELELECKREAMELERILDKEEHEEKYKHHEAKQREEFLRLDAQRRLQQAHQEISTLGFGGYGQPCYDGNGNSAGNAHYTGATIIPIDPRGRYPNPWMIMVLQGLMTLMATSSARGTRITGKHIVNTNWCIRLVGKSRFGSCSDVHFLIH